LAGIGDYAVHCGSKETEEKLRIIVKITKLAKQELKYNT
jgi:hypothetical protein